MEKQKEKMLREGNLPEDMGLIPGTFIMPRSKNRPSWTSNYKDRLKLEKARATTRFTDLGGYV